jgi:anti-sigma factor RsiW
MNCEKCQELLSDFLDGAMSGNDRATFNAHLEECLPCFNVHAEMNSIVTFCREHRGEYVAPPNERALWLRIQNTVESEFLTGTRTGQNPTPAAQREGWWSRMLGRSWELSFPQVAMAVVAIIVVASLATIFGLRGMQRIGIQNNIASTQSSSTGAPVMAVGGDAKAIDPSSRLWQQQQQIKYWSQIVEERKSHWNPQVRADFEHNLNLLDETVQESLKKLSAQPHDEVTEEMLNAALNDKMQLLKEFCDL